MRNSPYVPAGFTQREVYDAAEELPCPCEMVTADFPVGRRYRVAVRTPMDYHMYDRGAGCSSMRMRTLDFELNSALDYRTDTLVYWWTLVGRS